MMTRNEANLGLLAIMEVLDVAGDGGVPCGLLTAGLVASCRYSSSDASALAVLAERGGLTERSAWGAVHLTSAGRVILAKARAFAADAPVAS